MLGSGTCNGMATTSRLCVCSKLYVCLFNIIILSKLKVNGAHDLLGPTVDTLGKSKHEYILTYTICFTNYIATV